MKLEDILKELSVDKLDEAKQTEIKTKLTELVDVKARERADLLLKEEGQKLVKEYEEKFEEYKKDITTKFSSFVDSVLDEELDIPEKIITFARKGELYSELIEQFKIRLAIDEGALNAEVRQLLTEAKEEILKLKKETNELLGEKMELEKDAKLMAANLYLRKKCDGLTEAQRDKVLNLLSDISDKEELDRKFKYVLGEADGDDAGVVGKDPVTPGTETPKAEAFVNHCVCPKCGALASPKTECSVTACQHCNSMMKPVEDMEKAEGEEAVGEVDEPGEISGRSNIVAIPPMKIESVQPTPSGDEDENMKVWLKILRENKI
jgi:hypothetical protein